MIRKQVRSGNPGLFTPESRQVRQDRERGRNNGMPRHETHAHRDPPP